MAVARRREAVGGAGEGVEASQRRAEHVRDTEEARLTVILAIPRRWGTKTNGGRVTRQRRMDRGRSTSRQKDESAPVLAPKRASRASGHLDVGRVDGRGSRRFLLLVVVLLGPGLGLRLLVELLVDRRGSLRGPARRRHRVSMYVRRSRDETDALPPQPPPPIRVQAWFLHWQ